MKKVLVTGASGMIGRELLAVLRNGGFEIHAACRHVPSAGKPPGIVWHECDLLASGAVESILERVEPDFLYHLAWTSSPGTSNQPINLDWLEASKRLLAVFYQRGGTRALVAGTCFEYRWDDHPCSESETPLDPSTLYGKCKRDLLMFLRTLPMPDGASWAWGRIFFTYGRNEHPQRLVPSVIISLLRGERAECTHGRQIRDYLHAGDIAAGLAALFDSGWTGECNIAAGEAVTLADIARTAGDLIGRPELLALGARPAPPGEPSIIAADVSRAHEILTWRPAISLRKGLADAIAYWEGELESLSLT